MFKKTVVFAAACALALCVTAGSSFAGDHGPEEIILKTAKAKKPAKFPHKKHQEMMECATCHHTMNADGTQGPFVEGKQAPCESCHNKKDMKNKKLDSFKDVGHARCKTCHKKEKKAGKNAPTKCNGCHIKK